MYVDVLKIHCADCLHNFLFRCKTNSHSLVKAEMNFRLFLNIVDVKKNPQRNGDLVDMKMKLEEVTRNVFVSRKLTNSSINITS